MGAYSCYSTCSALLCAHIQIAKDMERWAKNVNAAKSVQQQQLQAVITQEREAATVAVTAAPTTTDSSMVALSSIKRTGVPLTSALQVVCMQIGN